LVGGVCTASGERGELAAVFPNKARTIVVGQWVANGVVGNCMAVVSGQQITPFGISVGVAVRGGAVACRAEVAKSIVGVGILLRSASGHRCGRGELIQCVIGVGRRAKAAARHRGDVAKRIIGILIRAEDCAVKLVFVLNFRDQGCGRVCGHAGSVAEVLQQRKGDVSARKAAKRVVGKIDILARKHVLPRDDTLRVVCAALAEIAADTTDTDIESSQAVVVVKLSP